MVSWLLIILVVIGLYIFIKFTGFQYSGTWTWLIGAIVIFFLINFGYLITRPGVDVNSFSDFISIFNNYFTWLGSIFDNAASITGEAVKTDWAGNLTTKK